MPLTASIIFSVTWFFVHNGTLGCHFERSGMGEENPESFRFLPSDEMTNIGPLDDQYLVNDLSKDYQGVGCLNSPAFRKNHKRIDIKLGNLITHFQS